MRVPGSLIVPDSRPPPVFLLGAGALLLAGLVIRTLRRRRTRSSSRSTRPADTVRGSWRLLPEGSVPLEDLRPLRVPVPVGRARSEEGAQKRGRATQKRP